MAPDPKLGRARKLPLRDASTDPGCLNPKGDTVQLHDTPEYRAWLAERKARFVRIHGEPDSDRTTCDACGITTSRAQLIDGTTCIECLAAEYGAHRLSVRLAGAFAGILAAFVSADRQRDPRFLRRRSVAVVGQIFVFGYRSRCEDG